jgi:hypothetical protein
MKKTNRPIEELADIEKDLGSELLEAQERYNFFRQAKNKPRDFGLDDPMIDKGLEFFLEQEEKAGWYDQQIAQWQNEGLTERQKALAVQFQIINNEYRDVSKNGRSLAKSLRKL